MPGRWSGAHGGHHGRHHEQFVPASRDAAGRPSLYEIVLRQAIVTQHGLSPSMRHELRACTGCGKPYLLTRVWLPLSDEGALACPRCGAEAVSWDGAIGYVAHWQREGESRRWSGRTRSAR